MNFSQSMGIESQVKHLQHDSMDSDLKNGLWNAIKLRVLDRLSRNRDNRRQSGFDEFCELMWHNYFKLPVDMISDNYRKSEEFIRDRFYKGEWYNAYNMVQWVAELDYNDFKVDTESFKEFCNKVMEREFSAYRFVDDLISPITNKYEIAEIESAIYQTEIFCTFLGANIHFKSALKKLSDKTSPDYRNSIKESISAIESVARVISDGGKCSLGPALTKLKSELGLHAALVKGFREIYGYTSDGDGIRHGLMEDENCEFEDAKYMLVSSSAFVNYLIAKAVKVGIEIK